jgi:hypothetical protein
VAIDTSNGIVNLRQTVLNGTFGQVPVNGTARNFRIYYRLSDASNKALNFIDVKLHYYERVSDVPANLLEEVETKNGAVLRKPSPHAAARIQAVSSRPPDIIIVGRAY